MNTARWERSKQILEDALRLPLEQRPTYLDSACCDDGELRAEVESLIASLEEAGSQFLAAPAADVLDLPGSSDQLPPLPALIGHYRLLAEIGRGGMGVVYRAEDITLGRSVAMKFLPAEFATDRIAFERFQREARAASALDHPNICSIYELGAFEGHSFIVMQLLDGRTLHEWIETPSADESERLRQCVSLAIQIAEALHAAHAKGIIHRDIKPANIFVTPRGDAKILDFGLAKILAHHPVAEYTTGASGSILAPSNPALSAIHLTRTGAAIGTAPYMSPEQIRGDKIDSRTDLFSLGLVLYEMATRQRAFAGDSADQIREAILHTESIPIRKLNPQVPAGLERIVKKALSKSCKTRYQSAADLSADLEKLKRQTGSRKAAAQMWRSPWIMSVVGLLAATLIAGGLYYRSRTKQPAAEKDTIILADFVNTTGDKAFDSTLKPELSAVLNQSSAVRVISEDRVTKLLQNMERPADTVLAPEIAREVCQRANVRAYVAGSFSSLGNQYIVGLKAMHCRRGDVLAQEQVTTASKESVLSALDSAAKKLGSQLGDTLASMPKLDLPLEDVTTSSLHALEAYSTGARVEREKGPAEALRYYQRAVELDLNFASGYSAIGNAYMVLGETTRASEYFSEAFQLREHVSRNENLGIVADYYINVTGELDQAEQACHNLIANYPRIWGPHIALGNVYAAQGLYAKASDEFREAVHLGNETNFENIVNMQLALQRFDEASKAILDAQVHKSGGYLLHLEQYALAFLKPDFQGMAEQQRWFASRPDVDNDGLALASDTEAYTGRVSKARELTRQSVESAIRSDSKETGGIWLENAALREAAFGNASDAKRLEEEGLMLAPESQGVQVEAALALAMIGDTAQPASLMKRLEKRYPLDTQVHALWLSPTRAQLALHGKNPSAALATLPDIGALEFGQISFLNNLSCLYPAYMRGEAYLAARQGAPAAAEFQKILDHSGMVWNCWTGALARLGVARAIALQAKASHGPEADAARAKALANYKDFLTLWKDADPGIPILKQAKAEYAKLQ
jgi:serine/threonine protein kinase